MAHDQVRIRNSLMALVTLCWFKLKQILKTNRPRESGLRGINLLISCSMRLQGRLQHDAVLK